MSSAALDFDYLGAQVDPDAASPTVLLRVRVRASDPDAPEGGAAVHALALRAQVRIEPRRRRYDDAEAAGLVDLFGSRRRWAETLNPLQLAFVSHVVPGFTGSSEVALPLPCSYDFDVAAHKYLYALDGGTAPLLLLFSGTLFLPGPGGLSVLPVPWDRECVADLPVAVWQAAMDQHFAGSAWLRVGRDTFDELYAYRAGHAMLSWDDAVRHLLAEAGP